MINKLNKANIFIIILLGNLYISCTNQLPSQDIIPSSTSTPVISNSEKPVKDEVKPSANSNINNEQKIETSASPIVSNSPIPNTSPSVIPSATPTATSSSSNQSSGNSNTGSSGFFTEPEKTEPDYSLVGSVKNL